MAPRDSAAVAAKLSPPPPACAAMVLWLCDRCEADSVGVLATAAWRRRRRRRTAKNARSAAMAAAATPPATPPAMGATFVLGEPSSLSLAALDVALATAGGAFGGTAERGSGPGCPVVLAGCRARAGAGAGAGTGVATGARLGLRAGGGFAGNATKAAADTSCKHHICLRPCGRADALTRQPCSTHNVACSP